MNPAFDNPRGARRLEGFALLLIAVSTLLIQQSVIRPWAEGRTPAGNRLLVSPIGVADHGAGTTGTPPVECRWWPKVGDAKLCEVAPGGEAAMTRLRRTYPLAVASLWTSVLALFLVALRVPRSAPVVRLLATAAVPVLAGSAIWSLASSARNALSVLQNSNVDLAQRGFAFMTGGLLFCALATRLLLISRKQGLSQPASVSSNTG